MAESRTCYMSNIELVSTEDCCGWRDIRFKCQCSCILQFTQHLRISSVLHPPASKVLSILVHPSAAVPHTGALSVCRGRGLERAGSKSNARYVRLRPSLIWAQPPSLSVHFKSSSQLKAVICNIWIDLSLKLLTPFEDFLLLRGPCFNIFLWIFAKCVSAFALWLWHDIEKHENHHCHKNIFA